MDYSMDSFDFKYKIICSIGLGCYSEVFKVRSLAHENTLFAAKKIPLKLLNCENSTLVKEIGILKVVSHPNIVKLLDHATSGDSMFLIMELAEGGELFDRIIESGCYGEKDARNITRQLLDACAYLHSIDIVHRDLKPENILFKTREHDSPIMVTDFGLSALLTPKEMLKTACGTPGYAAPEVLQRVPYNEKVDLWAIGVITYILLCGYPPFYNEEDNDALLSKQIVEGDFQYHSPYWDSVSEHAKHFVTKLLHKNFQERVSCKEALQLPWFQETEPHEKTNDSSQPQEGVEETTEEGESSLVVEMLRESVATRQWRRAFEFVSVVENRIKSLNIS